MAADNNNHAVHTAGSLEEAKRIIMSCERKSIGILLSRALVWVIVTSANICAGLLKFILFRHGGLAGKDFNNIVIYTVGIVGDNVVMLPALAAIRRRYSAAHITVISNCQLWDRKGAEEVFGPSRLKDRLIVISDYPVERRGLKLVFNKHLFPGVACDLFVNLSPFGNRGWIGAVIKELIFAYKLGASYAVGFHIAAYSRKAWFNNVKHYFVHNEPRRSRRVLRELGISPAEGEDLFEQDTAARESVVRKLRDQGWAGRRLFVINPGAKFMSKCWPAGRFAQVAEHIEEKFNACSVITGIEEERYIADEVIKNSHAELINLVGMTSIQELVELIRMSAGCVTNDTGTMHIAAMIKVPTVAIFSMRHSPTDWFPLGGRVAALFSTIGCMYCYDDECVRTECLSMIEVGHVVKALDMVQLA
jgi:ADP-heptose:LPS heptosyltransferase